MTNETQNNKPELPEVDDWMVKDAGRMVLQNRINNSGELDTLAKETSRLVEMFKPGFGQQVAGAASTAFANAASSMVRSEAGRVFHEAFQSPNQRRLLTADRMMGNYGVGLEREKELAYKYFFGPQQLANQNYRKNFRLQSADAISDEAFRRSQQSDPNFTGEGLLPEEWPVTPRQVSDENFMEYYNTRQGATRDQYYDLKSAADKINSTVPKDRWKATQWAQDVEHDAFGQLVLDTVSNLPQMGTAAVGKGINKLAPGVGTAASAAALILQEQGNFLAQSEPLIEAGMSIDLVNEYSKQYGLSSGLVEYFEQGLNLAMAGRGAAVAKATKDAILKKIEGTALGGALASKIGGGLSKVFGSAAMEGGQEALQQAIQNVTLSKMLQEWAKREGKTDLSKELAGMKLPIDKKTGAVDWHKANEELLDSFRAGANVSIGSFLLGAAGRGIGFSTGGLQNLLRGRKVHPAQKAVWDLQRREAEEQSRQKEAENLVWAKETLRGQTQTPTNQRHVQDDVMQKWIDENPEASRALARSNSLSRKEWSNLNGLPPKSSANDRIRLLAMVRQRYPMDYQMAVTQHSLENLAARQEYARTHYPEEYAEAEERRKKNEESMQEQRDFAGRMDERVSKATEEAKRIVNAQTETTEPIAEEQTQENPEAVEPTDPTVPAQPVQQTETPTTEQAADTQPQTKQGTATERVETNASVEQPTAQEETASEQTGQEQSEQPAQRVGWSDIYTARAWPSKNVTGKLYHTRRKKTKNHEAVSAYAVFRGDDMFLHDSSSRMTYKVTHARSNGADDVMDLVSHLKKVDAVTVKLYDKIVREAFAAEAPQAVPQTQTIEQTAPPEAKVETAQAKQPDATKPVEQVSEAAPPDQTDRQDDREWDSDWRAEQEEIMGMPARGRKSAKEAKRTKRKVMKEKRRQREAEQAKRDEWVNSDEFKAKYGDWTKGRDHTTIMLDHDGKPILDGNGVPLPKKPGIDDITEKAQRIVEEGIPEPEKATNDDGKSTLNGEYEVNSRGYNKEAVTDKSRKGKKQTVWTRDGLIQLAKKLFPGVAIEGKLHTFMGRALGYFRPFRGIIRVKDRRLIGVLAHEIGHSVDAMENLGLSKEPGKEFKPNIPPEVSAELEGLGVDLYHDNEPKHGYVSEGWAEFIRGYVMSDPALDEVAPNTLRWFEHNWAGSHPDTFAKFVQMRQAIYEFSGQTPEQTVREFWSKRRAFFPEMLEWENWKKWGKDFRSWGIHTFLDTLHFMYDQMKASGLFVDYHDPTLSKEQVADLIKNDPYLKATIYQNSAIARMQQAVTGYTTNLLGTKRTGESLVDALSLVNKTPEMMAEFIDYAVAMQAMYYYEAGLQPGLSKQEAAAIVAKNADNKDFQATLQRVTDWSRRVLHLLVESGAMSEREFNAIENNNPIYVKFLRHFNNELGRNGKKRGAPLHRRKGSVRDIEHPIAAMIMDVQRIIEIAQASDVARACVSIMKRAKRDSPVARNWMVEIDPPRDAVTVTPGNIRKILEGTGLFEENDPALGEIDKAQTIFVPAKEFHGKERVVALVIDGRRRFFQVGDERLYNMFLGMHENIPRTKLERRIRDVMDIMRANITYMNASFSLISNPIRDHWSTLVFSQYSAQLPLYSLCKAFVNGVNTMRGLSEDGILYKSMGLQMDTMAAHDLGGARKVADIAMRNKLHIPHGFDDMPNYKSMWRGQIVPLVTAGYHFYGEFLGIPEVGNRLMEFRGAYNYWKERSGDEDAAAMMASLASGDISVNFRRSGSFSKHPIVRDFLFFNASLQSIDKFLRACGVFQALPFEKTQSRAKRATNTLLRSGAFLSIPALMCYARNRDKEWWKNLPPSEKWRYLHLEFPNGLIVRLPLPFELGILFGALPVAAIENLKDGKSLGEALGTMAETLSPIDISGLHAFGRNYSVLAPLIDIMANKRWTGAPVVAEHIKTNRLPKDWVNNRTTPFAKWLGQKVIWPVVEGTAFEECAAPIYLDYLTQNYISIIFYMGEYLQRHSIDEMLHSRPYEVPIVGRLFLNPSRDRRVGEVYEERARLRQQSGSRDISLEEIGKLNIFNKTTDQFSGISNKQQEALADRSLSGRQKKDRYEELRVEMNNEAEKALNATPEELRARGLRVVVNALSQTEIDDDKLKLYGEVLKDVPVKEIRAALYQLARDNEWSIRTLNYNTGKRTAFGNRRATLNRRLRELGKVD